MKDILNDLIRRQNETIAKLTDLQREEEDIKKSIVECQEELVTIKRLIDKAVEIIEKLGDE